MKAELNSWKDRFKRECKYKSSIIVYGNIDDLVLDEQRGVYRPLIDNIIDQLTVSGYENIVRWDRVNGIDFSVSKDSIPKKNEINRESQGNTYSFDDEDLVDNNEQQEELNTYKEIEEFFYFMLDRINSNISKNAFIIDGADYIFGSSNTLSECERYWLSILNKCVSNSNKYDLFNSEFNGVGNIIILITQKLANIPTSYYINSPIVSTINISLPTRTERDFFLRSNLSMLSVSDDVNTDKVKYNDLVDNLDGFTLKEISQIFKLSKQKDIMSFEKLINLYKYGEKSSPWEELSREKLLTIRDRLKERVKGQDDAVEKVKDVIIRAYTGFAGLQHSSNQKKPKGVLFFVGPTGVGKTELAKSLAEFLFGDESSCIRFDMSEFNHEHSDQRLVGAPPGYVGYEEGGQLTNKIKEKPFSVVLFDEIEKAHGKILDKFLQILEDGRLTDGKGETVSFSETIIVFTSNIGAAKVSPNQDENEVAKAFIKEVKAHFVNNLGRPELLNRIGECNIVPFNFIDNEEVFKKIIKSKFEPIKKAVKERYKVDLQFENEDLAFTAIAASNAKENGGRGVNNIIESRIIDQLSNFIFMNNDVIYPGCKIIILQPISNRAIFDFEIR